MGNWVKIELDNGKINPSAVGALISVRTGTRTQTRRIQVGGGHASGRSGFCASRRRRLRTRDHSRYNGPTGEWSHPYRVFANQHVRIIRGEANARYWYPAQ